MGLLTPFSLRKMLWLTVLFLGAQFTYAQGDNCDQATPLTNTANFCSTASQYTNVGSTPSGYSAASCWTGSPLEDVWFSFVCTGTDVLIAVNGSTIIRPRIAIYTGSCTGTLNQIGGSGCANGTAGSPDAQMYVGGLVQGTTYLIRISSIQSQEGSFQLCINNYTPPPSASADCNGAGRLCNKNPLSVSGLNGGGSNNTEVDNTCMGGFLMFETNSVWYTWTCAASGTLTFDLFPANQFDDIDFAVFQLSTTDPCGPRTLMRCTAASCTNALASTGMNMSSTDVSEAPGCAPGENAYVQYINMTAGTSYALLINNASAATGFTLNWGGTGTFVGPDANITGAPFVVCAGTPISLNGSTSTGYNALSWNFNNGSGTPGTATGPGPISVTYPTAGSYTAILNATSATGCTSVETAIVTVNPIVTPTFAAQPGVCQNAPAPVLPATSTNGITGTWSPAVSTTTAGTTTYTFTPAAGQCATTTTLNLTVNPAVSLAFNAVADFCQGTTPPPFPTQTQSPVITGTWSPATISNTASGTYTFTPDVGQCASPTTISVTITNSITPTFPVVPQLCLNFVPPALPSTSTNGITGSWSPAVIDTWTAGSANYTFTPNPGGCAVPVTITVVVGPPPTPAFTQISAFCLGSAAPVFTTTSTNGITGTWSPAAISNTTSGTYTFTPTFGNCATTASMTITVNNPVTPTFTPIADVCAQSTAPVLPVSSTNTTPISGTWSPVTVSNSVSGIYTFTPTVGACATTASISINVIPSIIPVFDQLPGFCAGTVAPALSTSSTNGIDGSWSPATVNNTSTGIYTFTPNPSICAGSTTMTIIVDPAPDASFTANDTQLSQLNTEVHFYNESANGTSYVWDFGDGSATTTSEDAIHTYPVAPGSYVVTLTVTNTGGCADVATMTIVVEEDQIIYVPNTFTPDGDEFNPQFLPILSEGFDIYNYDLLIFDRWGEIVFESKNIEVGWDGTYHEKLVKEGAYTWQIKVKNKSNDKYNTYNGHILVIY